MVCRSAGISLYPGLRSSREDISDLIKKAADVGIRRVFTSLHIPEAEPKSVIEDCRFLCEKASEFNMEVVADISPRIFDFTNSDAKNLKPLKELGLAGIRADFGYSYEDIVSMIRNELGLKIVVNASDIDVDYMKELLNLKGIDNEISACHNFYPRRESGLSMEYVVAKSRELKKLGVEVSAFVPSQVNKRPIMAEGLPTVEDQRYFSPGRAAMELYATGAIDCVYIGDPTTSRKELEELVTARDNEYIKLRVKVAQSIGSLEREIAFSKIHYQRPGVSFSCVFRSAAGNLSAGKKKELKPNNNIKRLEGSVTIDNICYERYAGELQITKKDLKADKRVNVIGYVIAEDLPLLDYIEKIGKYKLVEI